MNTIKVNRSIFFMLSIFCGIYTLLSCLLMVVIAFDKKASFSGYQFFFGLCFIVAFIFGYLAFKSRIVLKLKEIQVFDDRIEIIYRKFKEVILFQDIKRFEVSDGKYKALSCEIHTDQKSFKFTPQTIQYRQMDFFVEALYKSRPDLLDSDRFAEVRAKHFFDLGKPMNLFIIAVISSIIICTYMGYIFQSRKYYFKGFSDFVFRSEYTFYGIMLLPFLISSFFLSSAFKKITADLVARLKSNPNELRENTNFSKSVLYKTFGIVSVVFMIYFSLIFKFELNLLSYAEANVDIPHMNLKAEESVWVDERYRCFNCNRKLLKEDFVSYESRNRLGVIVGFPQELVEINTDIKGRKLASTETVVVPKDQYAIRGGAKGEEFRLVPKRAIGGKVLKNLSDFF